MRYVAGGLGTTRFVSKANANETQHVQTFDYHWEKKMYPARMSLDTYTKKATI